jgi:hypothetical protein
VPGLRPMPNPGGAAVTIFEEETGPLRKNDQPHVCLRCGCVFLPLAVEDPDDPDATTACPICDRDPGGEP